MSDDLVTLGVGAGSKNESIKIESRYLRGTLAQELAESTSHLSEESQQLLKFHGSYQQEDRDQRQARKASGDDRAYQFMVRSRIPGGALTAEQYLAHDEIAGRYGNGSLRLTTRQGIQLHGVLKGDLRATIASLNETLISTLAACGDVNRNVMACPAPAKTPAHETVHAYAHRIAMHLAPRTRAYAEIWIDGEKVESETAEENEPIYGATYLPRKFKIGVGLPGDNCVDLYTQDIGLVAELDGDTLRGFTVLVGGGMGATHGKAETYPRLATPLCFVPPDDVIVVAETIVTIQRDHGDRKNRKHARMKYLIEERGIEWFRAELERRLGRAVDDPHAVAFETVDDHLGWHRQADGNWYLGLYVENGRVIDGDRVRLRSAMRELMTDLRPGLRITGQQNVLLTGIAAERRADAERILRAHGVTSDAETLGARRFAMACPALPTCGLAVAEAERALPALIDQIEADLASLGIASELPSIRMTGCPNGCARPRMGDIGIVGKSLGLYELYLGGDWQNTRLNEPFATLKYAQIAPRLRELFVLWSRERTAGERFGDYVFRVGAEHLRTATALLVSA